MNYKIIEIESDVHDYFDDKDAIKDLNKQLKKIKQEIISCNVYKDKKLGGYCLGFRLHAYITLKIK